MICFDIELVVELVDELNPCFIVRWVKVSLRFLVAGFVPVPLILAELMFAAFLCVSPFRAALWDIG